MEWSILLFGICAYRLRSLDSKSFNNEPADRTFLRDLLLDVRHCADRGNSFALSSDDLVSDQPIAPTIVSTKNPNAPNPDRIISSKSNQALISLTPEKRGNAIPLIR